MAECAKLPRICKRGGLNTDTAELEQLEVMTCMKRSEMSWRNALIYILFAIESV